jgi:alkyl sulfatase BDS1-like metallo-beta-lactamase superfamily hydrolase
MGYTRKRWPDYAGENADKAIDRTREIDRILEKAQNAAIQGEFALVVTMLGTARSLNLDVRELIVSARAGDFK